MAADRTWDEGHGGYISALNQYNEAKEKYDNATKALKQHIEDFLPELRNDMLKKSRSKIIKLTEDELSTEDVESDEPTTYTRIE